MRLKARQRRALHWFEPWREKGYTAEYARSGHIRVYDPEGHYVTSLSASPRNSKAPEHETGRILRRHHETMQENKK